jgi:glycerol-3-phosphate O-acyltransferase / dihydroxyacetone phosphate acyltransferase
MSHNGNTGGSAGKSVPLLYRVGRGAMRLALGFYFTRIERFHLERVPSVGPVLFTSNHPNSVTDAFVVGASVPRKVHFVATVQLFRWAPIRWLLTRCGVIPINRVKDDPRAMRSVFDTFEACYEVLEQGDAIGIFPEGITHDDPQLKTVKTGAARMALELEHRHGGHLGLQIVPVGLTFSAKDRYRSTALVDFGDAIHVSDFLAGYPEKRHERVHELSRVIAERIQVLILHLPKLENARIVAAVRNLYLERLRGGQAPDQAADLARVRAIAHAVEQVLAREPERAVEFGRRLAHYEHMLARLHVTESEVAGLENRGRWLRENAVWLLTALLGAPVALYGWAHRLPPLAVINWVSGKTAKQPADRTHISTTTLVVGAVVFPVFYLALVVLVHRVFGWPVSLWYGLSLVPAGLLAHYYYVRLARLLTGLRTGLLLLRAPGLAARLQARREELIHLIEQAHHSLPAEPVQGPAGTKTGGQTQPRLEQ